MPTTSIVPQFYNDLGTQVNDFMTHAAVAPYLANLPNYASMVGSRTENIGQQLKGQLPQDVINQIGQQAAERGVSNGLGQGANGNTNASYLRALGLNSLQMQQQGNQNLSTAIADTPVPQLFNPASLFVPQILAGQEQSAARAGLAAGSSRVGMPTIAAPTRTYGPDVTTGQPYSGGNFSNGLWNGNPTATNPTTLANNWWNSYGGTSLNSNLDFGTTSTPDTGGNYDWTGNSGYGYTPPGSQFDEEDAWLANNTSTLDASDPYTYFE